ncbi:MAG: AAA family ATPase [Lachnospiraceae bacterium]|nr:AAA family ATPase [Lachnospiraceae bacterium]
MYIIVEGMPGTGKTTITKKLAEKLDAVYVKSVFSNTAYGDSLRNILNSGKTKEVEYFYLVDLLLDELRINKLLAENSVVRDKTYTSSIAHLRAHGFINELEDVAMAIDTGYAKLAEDSIEPDYVVYIRSNREIIKQHLLDKADLSAWDNELTNDLNKHDAQRTELEIEMHRRYEGKLVEIDCFSGTVDEMCETIVAMIKEKKNV